MRKNDTQMKKSELLPFHIIKAASEGDLIVGSLLWMLLEMEKH